LLKFDWLSKKAAGVPQESSLRLYKIIRPNLTEFVTVFTNSDDIW